MSDDVNLVDSHGGTAHIDSNSIARKNQAFAGIGLRDSKIFWPFHNNFRIDILDATHVKLWNGAGMIQGRFFYMEDPTTLDVKPGTYGLNRRDAVVFRYKRDGEGVETVTPMVITGTATSGQATLPATLTDSDIYHGSTQADLLFASLEFAGTNIQVKYLYDRAESLGRLRTDLTAVDRNLWKALDDEQRARIDTDNNHSGLLTGLRTDLQKVDQNLGKALGDVSAKIDTIYSRKLVSDNDFNLSGVVVNGMAIITIRWTNLRGFHIGEWGTHAIGEITNGWKCDFEIGNWSIDNSYFNDCWFSLNGNHIDFRSRSAHDIAAGTWHLCTITAPVHK